VDLPLYDDEDYRYHHTDAEPYRGRQVVANVLRIPQLPVGPVLYDLWLYSGGIGVLNRLAITLPADPALWSHVVDSHQGRSPEEAMLDQSWADSLIWLLTEEEERVPIRPAAVQFINENRRKFQAECFFTSRILFGTRATRIPGTCIGVMTHN
jgi:hypothetical protein